MFVSILMLRLRVAPIRARERPTVSRGKGCYVFTHRCSSPGGAVTDGTWHAHAHAHAQTALHTRQSCFDQGSRGEARRCEIRGQQLTISPSPNRRPRCCCSRASSLACWRSLSNVSGIAALRGIRLLVESIMDIEGVCSVKKGSNMLDAPCGWQVTDEWRCAVKVRDADVLEPQMRQEQQYDISLTNPV